MIMVDIYVPSVDKEYDFNLDEDTKISTLIEEIAEMIAHKEQSDIVGSMSELILCDRSTRAILPYKMTLAECHINTGDSLIFV